MDQAFSLQFLIIAILFILLPTICIQKNFVTDKQAWMHGSAVQYVVSASTPH